MKIFDLSGRTAIVTGALGKLGPVWSEALLAHGANVFAIDLPSIKATPAFLRLKRKYPKKLRLHPADITDRRQLLSARRACRDEFGGAGILINNAGIDQPPSKNGKSHHFTDAPSEAMKGVFEVNFFGALQVLQIFGEDLAASGRGSVVNIGSLYARVSPDQRLYDHIPTDPPFFKPPAYGASKAALVNLTKYLATLWAPKGLRVNALSPGGVLGGQDEKFLKKYCSRVPMGRMATALDLVGPLIFLASDASSYVTGIDLIVDGGFTAW